jgi:cytochrome c-type biogenesis protein
VLLGLLATMTLIGLIVFVIALPMSRVLGFAIPFIDLLLVALGLMLLAGVNPFLRVRAFAIPGARSPLAQAVVYGMFLGPVALPCAGPFLVALLAISVSAVETVGALATFFVFGLGFGFPLLLLSLLASTRRASVVAFLVRHHRAIEIVSGGLLIAAGLWDLSTNWRSILLAHGI